MFRTPFAFVVIVLAATAGAQQSTVTAGATQSSAGKLDVDVVTGDTTTSAFRIFNSANTELFRVTANGNVGFGVTPATRFHVQQDVDTGTILLLGNANAGSGAHAAFRAQAGTAATLNAMAHGAGRSASLIRFGQPLAGWSEVVQTDGNGLIVGTLYQKPLLFGTYTQERMRIHPGGNVAIGTTNDSAKLTLASTTDHSKLLSMTYTPTVEANATQEDTGAHVFAGTNVLPGVTNSGWMIASQAEAWNTGLGVLSYAVGGRFYAGVPPSYPGGTVQHARGVEAGVLKGSGTVVNGYGVFIGDVQATNSYGVYQASSVNGNHLAGNTAIGCMPTANKLEVCGNARFEGNAHFTGAVTGGSIRATYQDVAEWVPSAEELAPGTVVVLDPSVGNRVLASSRSYDTTVAGVVSEQPGILLGVPGDEKEQIATTGRVRVRVDARRAPIRIGDLLVTSEQPGTAMRSEPLEISGRAFHQPGTILGKALESLDSGVGEILVLLSLQ